MPRSLTCIGFDSATSHNCRICTHTFKSASLFFLPLRNPLFLIDVMSQKGDDDPSPSATSNEQATQPDSNGDRKSRLPRKERVKRAADTQHLDGDQGWTLRWRKVQDQPSEPPGGQQSGRQPVKHPPAKFHDSLLNREEAAAAYSHFKRKGILDWAIPFNAAAEDTFIKDIFTHPIHRQPGVSTYNRGQRAAIAVTCRGSTPRHTHLLCAFNAYLNNSKHFKEQWDILSSRSPLVHRCQDPRHHNVMVILDFVRYFNPDFPNDPPMFDGHRFMAREAFDSKPWYDYGSLPTINIKTNIGSPAWCNQYRMDTNIWASIEEMAEAYRADENSNLDQDAAPALPTPSPQPSLPPGFDQEQSPPTREDRASSSDHNAVSVGPLNFMHCIELADTLGKVAKSWENQLDNARSIRQSYLRAKKELDYTKDIFDGILKKINEISNTLPVELRDQVNVKTSAIKIVAIDLADDKA